MILTAGLKNFIENYKAKLSPEAFQKLIWDMDQVFEQFQFDLSTFAPGLSRGRRVHDLLETEIERANKDQRIKTSCQKGCAACCHFEVEITRDDAAVLKEAIAQGVAFDQQRLQALAKRERQGPEWQAGVVASNRCLFLDAQNNCSVYESRPSACRKLSVISPPAECSLVGGHPIPQVLPLAEILISASLSTPENPYGSLARMLKDAIVSHDSENAISL